jgi:novobiocin biosynthesis protein NovU/D-mycarose 3-C-methyltransferase
MTSNLPAASVLSVRDTCRACGSRNLAEVLSLGEVPLANAFLREADLRRPEPRFPLIVYFCPECWLLQLRHVVHPEVLFSNYLYRTGTNVTIARHNAALAGAVVGRLGLKPQHLVVEIASNDGSLLACFRDQGPRTLGVEPAQNIAALAREAGIETINEFFNEEVARKIIASHGRASAVLANNVLAHVDDTVGFLRACRALLAPEGRVIVEAPYLAEMLGRFEYDTIYHEHLCYFGVRPLMRLFEAAGMELEQVDRVEIHGGSLRLWGRATTGLGHGPQVLEMAEAERRAGFGELATYRVFAETVAHNRERLLDMLRGWRTEGKKVAGYGAPAKGNTLLCYCGIDTTLVPWTVDRSPLKIGMYTPGGHIPIYPTEKLLEERPDVVFLLSWNFAEEILEFLRPLREQGTRVLIPIPEPRLI